jgi:hypothetical protein
VRRVGRWGRLSWQLLHECLQHGIVQRHQLVHLQNLVDTWLELAATMTIRDLDAPRASLARGAAGVVYTLFHIGSARADPAAIAASKRWVAIARRAASRPDGFGRRQRGIPGTGSSLVFGPPGVAAVAAIVAPSLRSLAEHVAFVRRRAPAEYTFGIAGNLHATIAIARAKRTPAAAELVRDLARRLARAKPPLPGGFAHGDLGVTAARLAAARECGEPVDPALVESLAATNPDRALASPYPRSWCNGLAGYTIAWVLAADLDERCRANALAAASRLLEVLDESGPSLCCGLGGRAYALLAVARLDPQGPWIDHAITLATRALAHEIPSGGVFQGFPGLVMLAHDLQTPERARFPFVDFG